MKILVMVRHAKSSWDDTTLRDFDRPLNSRGLRDSPVMAAKLHEHLDNLDVLISSPANRAKSTSEYFAHEFALTSVKFDERIYEASSNSLLEVIHEIDNDQSSAILFGHNPGFTSVINKLTESYIDNVPTCGVAIMKSDVNEWSEINWGRVELASFIYPKMYI